jgi:RimJ/RimL family protein N-acetyltransferase
MLRAAEPGDFAFLHSVARNPDYARFVEDVSDAVLTDYLNDPQYALVIWERDGAPKGFALFCGLGSPAGTVELRRLALAEAGGGLGRAFITDLRDYGFEVLGADCLWLDVVTENPRAKHLYEDLGFQHEGTLRARWKRPAGDLADLHVLSILRSEWQV